MCNINTEILGTWIGSIGTLISVIILGRLAFVQNEVNKYSQNVEIGKFYLDHYQRLKKNMDDLNYIYNVDDIYLLRYVYLNKIVEKMDLIRQLHYEAELILHDDIVEITRKICFFNKRKLEDLINKQNISSDDVIKLSRELGSDLTQIYRRHIIVMKKS